MGEKEEHDYYFGNLPKTASEVELRTFLKEYGDITRFEYRLAKCTYCPTKIAYIVFSKALESDAMEELNKKTFQQKRLFVCSTKSEKFFTPLLSVVVRYLNEHISEEDLYKHFSTIGPVECVQKPAHNYAYVSFRDNSSIRRAFEMKQSVKGIEPYIVAVRRKISMFLEPRKPMAYASLKEKCKKLDLVYNPAAENEATMLVTNIPRDTEEDDVLEFLGKFGKIVDWEMQKSSTCVMSNVGYVTYQHPKMARTAYLCCPLNFQGFGMDVYNRLVLYTSKDSDQTVIIRRTSVCEYSGTVGRLIGLFNELLSLADLTNDEIYEQCAEYGRVEYIQRMDAVNYNTIVRLDTEKAAMKVTYIKHIAGEEVVIRFYTAKMYVAPTLASRATNKSVPPKRSRKESMLLHISDIEERRNLTMLPTTDNGSYFNVNPLFYRNEVQVWNYAPRQGLVEFREFFKKYGNVINLREMKENDTSTTGVVYLSFETKLEARRVCKLNHSFMCSRRLLILMADQCIMHDPKLCVKVSNLTEEITDEDVHDRFGMIGDVRYVFRPKTDQAVVCMAKEKWQARALKVMCVGRFYVVVSSLLPAGDQQQPAWSTHSMPQVSGPSDWGTYMGPVPTSANGPMGSMPPMGLGPDSWRSLGPPVPPSVPFEMQAGMIPPGGPSMPMPMPGPMDPGLMGGGSQISPRMRSLMQAVEAQMIKSKNFTTLSMGDQFNLVRDVINQCLSYPTFLSMPGDEKIRYLISGTSDFRQINIFTLFTYPEQLKMLSTIESYYRSTCPPGSLPAPAPSEPSQTPGANSLVVLTQDSKDGPATASATRGSVALANNSNDPKASPNPMELDDDDIPPAPSPPPISFRSRSTSPVPDGAANGTARKRPSNNPSSAMAGKVKLAKKRDNEPWAEKPYVFVGNLPKDISQHFVLALFRKYGNILHISEPQSRVPDSTTYVLKFETMHQANMALELNLTMLQGKLLRVELCKRPHKSRPGRAIMVVCTGIYSEVEIFDTFKSCGKISFIRTIEKPEGEVCLIDFEDKESATAALKITYLHNGNRCKATPHEFASPRKPEYIED
uniref:RRM domain-containing protein n=1 Tax=Anopheles dirus TaxID=7168 RepID=A0A182NS18_9DIPT